MSAILLSLALVVLPRAAAAQEDGTTSPHLRAKTGWGRPEGGEEVGWKVGWVERGEERFFFAVLIHPPEGAFPMRRAQEEITREILEELGVL